MKTESLTKAFEDYLKVIYALSQSGERVPTNQIAERLNLTPASVTGMLQRMAANDPPLVEYRKHQGVRLTTEGEQAALQVIRHHRLLETYLVMNLGYTWDTVHEEACRLEHVISEEMEERIAAQLGDPQRDPHGEFIPTSDLLMPPDPARPLSTLIPNQYARVVRVSANNSALLRYLGELGLVPGAEIEVLFISPFDGNMTIIIDRKGETPLVLGSVITNEIFVEEIDGDSVMALE